MNSRTIACASLGLFCGWAAAQSTGVTLQGAMDVNVRDIKNDGYATKKAMGSDGLNNSMLRFSGIEDLGNGSFAEFWLEGQTTPFDGNGSGFAFKRRSTVDLRNNDFGEIRLGRDYTPTFWGLSAFDPFGHNGIGLVSGVDPYGPIKTFVRADNQVSYVLPRSLPGLYGQISTAPGEGVANARYLGARLGYTKGPVNVQASIGKQNVNQGAANAGSFRTWTAGGKYTFSFASIQTDYIHETLDSPTSGLPVGVFKHWMVGTAIPFGFSEIHASFNRGTLGGGNGAKQLAAGYVYNLSKRTALYGTYSRLSNEGNFAQSIDGGLPGSPTKVIPGGKSQGLEAGIRHFF